MPAIASDDDYLLPRVSSIQPPPPQNQSRRGRQQRRSISCCGVVSTQVLSIDVPRKSNYSKIPKQDFKLTVHKLDGSSFDVEVARKATVAELKQAVERVFSPKPFHGTGVISWSHVWGSFCLCFDDWKLLADSELLSTYGITDGDQLYFTRHVSIKYNLVKRRSKDRSPSPERSRRSDDRVRKEPPNNEKKDGGSSSDQVNSSQRHHHSSDDKNKDIISRRQDVKFSQFLGGWFSHRKQGNRRRSSSCSPVPRSPPSGVLESFRSILRFHSRTP